MYTFKKSYKTNVSAKLVFSAYDIVYDVKTNKKNILHIFL